MLFRNRYACGRFLAEITDDLAEANSEYYSAQKMMYKKTGKHLKDYFIKNHLTIRKINNDILPGVITDEIIKHGL